MSRPAGDTRRSHLRSTPVPVLRFCQPLPLGRVRLRLSKLQSLRAAFRIRLGPAGTRLSAGTSRKTFSFSWRAHSFKALARLPACLLRSLRHRRAFCRDSLLQASSPEQRACPSPCLSRAQRRRGACALHGVYSFVSHTDFAITWGMGAVPEGAWFRCSSPILFRFVYLRLLVREVS